MAKTPTLDRSREVPESVDAAANLAKWQFPSMVLADGGYVVVFASAKNRALAGAGYPTNWTADDAMDSRIVAHPAYTDELLDGLFSIPTLSIAIDIDDLFSPTDGIYTHPDKHGVAWERSVSVELICRCQESTPSLYARRAQWADDQESERASLLEAISDRQMLEPDDQRSIVKPSHTCFPFDRNCLVAHERLASVFTAVVHCESPKRWAAWSLASSCSPTSLSAEAMSASWSPNTSPSELLRKKMAAASEKAVHRHR